MFDLLKGQTIHLLSFIWFLSSAQEVFPNHHTSVKFCLVLVLGTGGFSQGAMKKLNNLSIGVPALLNYMYSF